jgi:hypothetical protein
LILILIASCYCCCCYYYCALKWKKAWFESGSFLQRSLNLLLKRVKKKKVGTFSGTVGFYLDPNGDGFDLVGFYKQLLHNFISHSLILSLFFVKIKFLLFFKKRNMKNSLI